MSEKENLILAVDDSKTVQLLLKKDFENIYQVETCSLPSEAREILKVKAKEVDVILLDVNISEINGWEFCKELKSQELTQDIPVIFLSGHEKNEDIIRGIEIGASDYVTKPFDINILKVRIDNLIRMKNLQAKQLEFKNLESFKAMTITLSHEINNGLVTALGALMKIKKNYLPIEQENMTNDLVNLEKALQRIQSTVKGLKEVDANQLTQYSEHDNMLDLKGSKR